MRKALIVVAVIAVLMIGEMLWQLWNARRYAGQLRAEPAEVQSTVEP